MIVLISLIILICINGLKSADIEIRGITNVQMGSNLSLTCNGTGLQSAMVNIDWYKDGEELIPGDRISITVNTKVIDQSTRTVSTTLTVKDMVKEDEGQYKCWMARDLNKQVSVRVSGNKTSGAETMNFIASPAALILAATVIAFCNKNGYTV